MIPRYAPEWTNHNPSDPGITLLELAAWMTDLIIYRLNQVPDKNYVAFLNLLGIRLRPPRSARGLLQFKLVEQAQRQKILRGRGAVSCALAQPRRDGSGRIRRRPGLRAQQRLPAAATAPAVDRSRCE